MRLIISKVTVVPTFQLVDEDNTIVDETTSSSIVMFPGKFLDFKALVTQLETAANLAVEEVEKLHKRPLL